MFLSVAKASKLGKNILRTMHIICALIGTKYILCFCVCPGPCMSINYSFAKWNLKASSTAMMIIVIVQLRIQNDFEGLTVTLKCNTYHIFKALHLILFSYCIVFQLSMLASQSSLPASDDNDHVDEDHDGDGDDDELYCLSYSASTYLLLGPCKLSKE